MKNEGAHFVLPTVVALDVVWNLGLHIVWKAEIRLGGLELSIDLLNGDAVVNQGKEACVLACLDKLLGDIFFACVKVCQVKQVSDSLPTLAWLRPQQDTVLLSEMAGTTGAVSKAILSVVGTSPGQV